MKQLSTRCRYAVSRWSLVACLGLTAIYSRANEADGIPPPEPQLVQQVLARSTAEEWSFTTPLVLEGSEHGLRGDGVTDNTVALRKLLEGGNRTVHLKAGDYVTGKLTIESKTILRLDPGVTLRDSGRLASEDRLINIRSEDVRIEAAGARVIADRSSYATGEQRHGVLIYGAKRVVIKGLKSTGHSGDGFYIGGPQGSPATDIVLKNCSSDGNRRQGLSVTSARGLRVIDSEFTNTRGTNPQAGIAFEPNSWRDEMQEIVLLRPLTKNNVGGGILVYLGQLNSDSKPAAITIVSHRSEMEKSLRTSVPDTVSTTIRYSRFLKK